ncbi:hypothetical protein HanHA89_Chr12g0475461 [Helianthus annuus]|nr:hypothetical protein HanHA89_Chr12g0475461 [Helianthus annuus]
MFYKRTDQIITSKRNPKHPLSGGFLESFCLVCHCCYRNQLYNQILGLAEKKIETLTCIFFHQKCVQNKYKTTRSGGFLGFFSQKNAPQRLKTAPWAFFFQKKCHERAFLNAFVRNVWPMTGILLFVWRISFSMVFLFNFIIPLLT